MHGAEQTLFCLQIIFPRFSLARSTLIPPPSPSKLPLSFTLFCSNVEARKYTDLRKEGREMVGKIGSGKFATDFSLNVVELTLSVCNRLIAS